MITREQNKQLNELIYKHKDAHMEFKAAGVKLDLAITALSQFITDLTEQSK